MRGELGWTKEISRRRMPEEEEEEEKGGKGSYSGSLVLLFSPPEGRGGISIPPFETRQMPTPLQMAMPTPQRFSVELRPNETTVISWKKLVKDLQKTNHIQALASSPAVQPPVGAHPALEARIAPEALFGDSQLQKDGLPAPAPNRFSAVIEKIERLYKGDSSDEELDEVPDDDQYDTDDSFIDDAELDEYFSVDKSKTKHSGFFINRGKLERVSEPALSPVHGPKKRKRKDVKKISSERSVEEIPKKLLKVGSVRMKAAARSAPLVGLNVANSGQVRSSSVGSENLLNKTNETQEVKVMQNQASTFGSGPIKTDRCKENINKEEASLSVKASQKEMSKTPADIKDGGKLKSNVLLGSKDSFVKGAMVVDPMNNRGLSWSEKIIPLSADSQTRKYVKDSGEIIASNKLRIPEKVWKGGDSRDVNSSGNKLLPSKMGKKASIVMTAKQRKKSSSPVPKEDSPGRLKGSMLERAIQELENSVAELCPPTMDIQEHDQSSQGVKRRLPGVVKLKLAKVARLATNQGKISNELIDRLMCIVGHIIQLKTLKRNLKEMIELGKSAKQEKESKLQDIKREVTEMVKMRVSSLKSKGTEQQEGSSDDFQGVPPSVEKGASSGCCKWDIATEDRLCDLYDQYIEGMDEHKGSQIRKLYVELADLWPEGWMDNNGIKHAVYRAKERKKRLNKVGKGMEKSKSKNVSEKLKTVVWNEDVNVASESNVNCQSAAPCDKSIEVEHAHSMPANEGHTMQCKIAKAKSTSTIDEKKKYVTKPIRKEFKNVTQWNNQEGNTIFKNKPKRKPDTDTGITPTQSMKNGSFHGKEMHKIGKQMLHGSSVRNKGSPQVTGLPRCEFDKIC